MLRTDSGASLIWRRSPYVGLVLAAAAVAVIAVAWPRSMLVDLLSAAAIFGIYVASWAIFCGPALEVSFGHAFFIGSVAYLTALLHVRVGASTLATMIVAPAVGALLGIVLAGLSFRHRGLYFSMATMALQLTLYRCLFLYSPLFGGEEGIYGIQTLTVTRSGALALTASAGIGALVIAHLFVRSRHCLLLAAVGHNERLAEAAGVPVALTRAKALALSGALAAVGSVLYVFTVGQANVELAGDRLSARIVLLGMIAGPQSPTAPLVTGVVAYVADQLLSNTIQYTGLVMSVVLLFAAIKLPRGLSTTRPQWKPPTMVPRRRPKHRQGSFELDGISIAFGGVQALRNVTFALKPGTVTGIIGPNGAGKTTLLRVMGGELDPDTGWLHWDGRRILGNTSRRARFGLRKTFQHVEIFGGLTIREHLAVAMTVHGTTLAEPGVEELLGDAGLLEELDERVEGLPAATARIVDLAMAVAARPRIVLLDEPFAGMSTRNSIAVNNAVRRMRQNGVTVLIVEHRLKELFALIDCVIVLDRGRVIAVEPPERVFENPSVLTAYGTKQAAMDA